MLDCNGITRAGASSSIVELTKDEVGLAAGGNWLIPVVVVGARVAWCSQFNYSYNANGQYSYSYTWNCRW